MTIDWSKPIEAVHEDGRVEVARAQRVRGYTSHYVSRGNLTPQFGAFVNDEGEPVEPSSWRIRNVADHIPDAGKMVPEHPTPTQYAPELAPELLQRLQQLARRVAEDLDHEAGPVECALQMEARSIVSDLPREVDPDLIAARDCVVRAYEAAGRKDLAIVAASGKMDGRLRVQAALLAIARGRQLQRGEAA